MSKPVTAILHAEATFTIKSWDEKPVHEIEGGGKLTRASVTKVYEIDLAGKGTVEFLMAYRTDGSANFVGMERVVGHLGDRSGSFVLQSSGTYENDVAKAQWFVVPGSGTGNLRGLKAEGSSAVGHEERHRWAFDYNFE
jgi:hypothetical protein